VRDIGVSAWAFSRIAGRVTGTGPPAIFTTLGRTRGLFWGWLHFAGRLMPFGRLTRREAELVILTVAHLSECDYEWQHHVQLGRRAGVRDIDLAAIREGSIHEAWTEREQVMIDTVRLLHRDGDLDDPAWTRLHRALGDREAIELLLLAGHYGMLATVLTVLRVPPDPAQATSRPTPKVARLTASRAAPR